MSTARRLRRIPVGLSYLLLTAIAAPAPASTEISGGAAVGYEYDSNVAVDEVEQASGRGDNATVMDLDLALDQTFGETVKAGLSYGYSRTDYNQFSNFSRETHILGANLNVDLGDVAAGLGYFYIDALLDGDGFLNYQRLSPSLSGFVSKRWFLRGAYVYADKTIDQSPGRDAESHGGEFDVYFFWRGLRRYINAGYVYKTEDSVAPRFDFDAHSVKLRFLQRFDFYGELAAFELAARYEDRDYSAITPSIGEIRDDDRLRLKAELELPLNTWLVWQLYTSYGDYNSNLPAAAYEQTVVGTRIEATF